MRFSRRAGRWSPMHSCQETIIRKKVVGNYLLYYRADKERKTVWLLRIVYGRRDMDEVLKHVNS